MHKAEARQGGRSLSAIGAAHASARAFQKDQVLFAFGLLPHTHAHEMSSSGTPQRTILITGCSSGCGRDAALALRDRGWRVFAACRKQADCNELKALGFDSPRIDYQEESSIDSGFDEVMAATGGTLDALYNNGAYSMRGAVEDVPTDALRAMFEANFFGWHHLTAKTVKVMRKQGEHGRGHIIQHSSGFGMVSGAFNSCYCATKFALEAHSQALRQELFDTDIKVVLLNTGLIKTSIREKSRVPYNRWIAPVVETSYFRTYYRQVIEPRLFGPYVPDKNEEQVDSVTRKVIAALETSSPPVRYYITFLIWKLAVAVRLFPSALVDKLYLQALTGKKLHGRASAHTALHPQAPADPDEDTCAPKKD